MFGRLLGSFLKPTKFSSSSTIFRPLRNVNTSADQKILRWKKVNDLPLSVVNGKLFLGQEQDKLLLVHHPPLHFKEPNIWSLDTDAYSLKTLSEVSPSPIYIDHVDLQDLPLTKEFLNSYIQKLNQNLSVINKKSDLLHKYEKDYSSIVLGETPSKISDEERTSIRTRNISYFSAFHDTAPFSTQFGAVLDNLVLQLLTPEDLAIAAPLSQSFIVDLLSTVKSLKGKSNVDIFDALVKKYNVPIQKTHNLRGIIDFGRIDNYIWKLNQRGQQYWLFSSLEKVEGYLQDYAIAAYVQKVAEEKWKTTNTSPCPIIPDLFRQNLQPQVWGPEAPKFDLELDSFPAEWKTESYRLFNIMYEKSTQDLIRDASYRLKIPAEELKIKAQERVSRKFSLLFQYQNFVAKNQLLEVPHDEAIAPLKQALATPAIWETAEVLYKEGAPISKVANEVIRMTKVKVPSSHYNQVTSYLENAVFSRFHNPSMTGAAMNRLRAFVARDLDLDVKLPLTEVRWHYQVSLGDGRLFSYKVGQHLIDGEVRAAIVDTSGEKVTATPVSNPPFSNGVPVYHDGKVYVVGWHADDVLPFSHPEDWKPSASVWIYDVKASKWEKLQTSGAEVEVVYPSYETTPLIVENKLYYVVRKEDHYDIYRLDLSSNDWEKLNIKGVQPTPLYGAQIITASMFGKQKIVALFGNVQNDWDNHPDDKNIFILDIETLTWEADPTVLGDVPQGRKDVASIFYPEDGVVVVAGGRTEEKAFKDIYTLSVEKV